MANRPGPQRALGSRGQTINASSWVYFDGLLRAVSARTGVNYDTLIVEGTRTRERQAFLYANRFKPGFNPAYPPDSPYAYHVAGDAVDFGAGAGTRGTPVQRALHELGPSFGIFFEVSNELWHGRCDLSRVPNLTPAGSGATPIDNEDDEMNAEEKAQLRFVFEVLSAPGPVNGGVPLVQQIGGAFRDSAAAKDLAQTAATNSQFVREVLSAPGEVNGGVPLAAQIGGIVKVVDAINATVNRVIKRDTKAVVTPASDNLTLSQADDDVQANTAARLILTRVNAIATSLNIKS